MAVAAAGFHSRRWSVLRRPLCFEVCVRMFCYVVASVCGYVGFTFGGVIFIVDF